MDLKAVGGIQQKPNAIASNKASKPDEEMKELFLGKPKPEAQAKPLPVVAPQENPNGDDQAIIAFKKIRDENTVSFDLDKDKDKSLQGAA